MTPELKRRIQTLEYARRILREANHLIDDDATGDERVRLAQLVEWSELLFETALNSDRRPPAFAGYWR